MPCDLRPTMSESEDASGMTIFEQLELSDDTRIVVTVLPRWEGITVRRLDDEGVLEQIDFPCPTAGIGGGRIIASPSERLILISLFSGQSEEGYELFVLDNGMRKVASQEYEFGESASYCFSPDESHVVMALPFTCSEWWSPWDDGQVEPLDRGRLAFDFGQLRIQEIATGHVCVSTIRISAPESWSPERRDYDEDMRPRFLPDGTLALSMPWRDIVTSVPPPATIVVSVDE